MKVNEISLGRKLPSLRKQRANRDKSNEHVLSLPHHNKKLLPTRRVLKDEVAGSKVTHWEGNPITFDTDHHLVISTLRRPRSIARDKWRSATHQGYLVAVSAPKGLTTKEDPFVLFTFLGILQLRLGQ
ncbi:hypothetical protein TNCV_816171 [Trichonephila clavipes]|nr:hypothetical protein TNCV_816171 [Trichonephila clavipes]